MAQTINTVDLQFFDAGVIYNQAARQSIADQTYTTNGTISAAQNMQIAGLLRCRVRIRMKAFAAAGGAAPGTITLKVSTTSAMTSPEQIAVAAWPQVAATTDIIEFDLFGWSHTGYQFAQLSVAGLTNATSTVTFDAVFDGI